MVGAVRSIRTVAGWNASGLPALSMLREVIVFSPFVTRVKLVPDCTTPPSTVYSVAVMSDRLSLADSCTVTALLTHAFESPVMLGGGAVRSISTAGLLVAVVYRPTPFWTVLERVTLDPSPVIVVSAGGAGI